MADLSKLNKLNSGGYKYKNPYTQKEDVKKPAKEPYKPEVKEKGIIESHGYEMGRVRMLQDEVNNLKLDIVTLLQIMEGNFPQMTMMAVREKYSNFRADSEHVAQRIVNKHEIIN